ncbi:hypothetical protein [Calorimonas adulescens]|nr:hypothetical protein [Calorimonas adulescens]
MNKRTIVFVIVITAGLITAIAVSGTDEWLFAGQRVKDISQTET